MRNVTWNKKVAASRGEDWRKSLVEGKLKAKMNPTKLQMSRAKNKWAQIEVAGKLGLSLATYGAIERSKRPVTQSNAEKISKYFGKPVTTFFAKHKKSRLIAK